VELEVDYVLIKAWSGDDKRPMEEGEAGLDNHVYVNAMQCIGQERQVLRLSDLAHCNGALKSPSRSVCIERGLFDHLL
jgi:hypothetical protein